MPIPEHHPFAELIGLTLHPDSEAGFSRCELRLAPRHLNPHGVVHGAVLFALADTGMGAALYTTLAPAEQCATIEVKINYFKAVCAGTLVCETRIVHRGRRLANLESQLHCDGVLLAQANGNYAILASRAGG